MATNEMPNLDEFKNSEVSKINAASGSSNDISPVVTGSTMTQSQKPKKQQSLLGRIVGSFIKSDAQTIKRRFVEQVLKPKVTDILVQGGKSMIDSLFYGNNAPPTGGVKISYNSQPYNYNVPYSYNQSPVNTSYNPGYYPQPQSSNVVQVDEILYSTMYDAISVRDAMRDIIRRSAAEHPSGIGFCSVAAYLRLSNRTPDRAMEYYGWTNLDNAQVVGVQNMYAIELPQARPRG